MIVSFAPAFARVRAARAILLATALAMPLAMIAGCSHLRHAPPTLSVATPAAKGPALSSVIDMDASHEPENVLVLDLSNGGRVLIRMMPAWAPHHVERVRMLARQGFYDGIIFHRVIDGFMAQTGDPTGTGNGGSKLPDLKAEFNTIPHVRGSVSMARTDNEDSANSQFFIVFYPHFSLDHHYTNFGRVIAGMDQVDTIERGEPPTSPTKIVQASIESDHKARPAPMPVAAPIVLPGAHATPLPLR